VAVSQAYPIGSSVYMAQARTEMTDICELGYAATASRDYQQFCFRRAMV